MPTSPRPPESPPGLPPRAIEPLPAIRKIVFRPKEVRLAEAVTAPEAPMRVAAPWAGTDPSAPRRTMDPGYRITDAELYEEPTVNPSRPVVVEAAMPMPAYPWRVVVLLATFLVVAFGLWVAYVVS